MCSIELVPSLSHCIETVAKEAYWNLANKYMRNEPEDKELTRQIELLKAFLEMMDFGRLRSESEMHLVEGRTVKFVIYWQGNKPGYDMVIS
ncbi:hypothetical protein ES706_04682 [subsurface metagenome]